MKLKDWKLDFHPGNKKPIYRNGWIYFCFKSISFYLSITLVLMLLFVLLWGIDKENLKDFQLLGIMIITCLIHAFVLNIIYVMKLLAIMLVKINKKEINTADKQRALGVEVFDIISVVLVYLILIVLGV